MSAETLLPTLMPADQFVLLCLYVMALTGTPGPANMAFVAVSSSHGIMRTVPFLFGTLAGFLTIYTAAAAGLLALLTGIPFVWGALKIACIAYIAYLAWMIATADPPERLKGENASARRRAPGFLRGFWIHPLSPKAYAMQIAAISQFTVPVRYSTDALVIALTFLFLGGAMNFCWVVGGSALSALTRNAGVFRTLNVSLAVMMVAATAASLVAT